MEIIIAAILFAAIWVGNAPHRQCKRDGTDAWLKASRTYNAALGKTAQKMDYYYKDDSFLIDSHFYSDGSLREDPVTHKKYGKGKYYCDSRGYGPNMSKPPDGAKPPE